MVFQTELKWGTIFLLQCGNGGGSIEKNRLDYKKKVKAHRSLFFVHWNIEDSS